LHQCDTGHARQYPLTRLTVFCHMERHVARETGGGSVRSDGASADGEYRSEAAHGSHHFRNRIDGDAIGIRALSGISKDRDSAAAGNTDDARRLARGHNGACGGIDGDIPCLTGAFRLIRDHRHRGSGDLDDAAFPTRGVHTVRATHRVGEEVHPPVARVTTQAHGRHHAPGAHFTDRIAETARPHRALPIDGQTVDLEVRRGAEGGGPGSILRAGIEPHRGIGSTVIGDTGHPYVARGRMHQDAIGLGAHAAPAGDDLGALCR